MNTNLFTLKNYFRKITILILSTLILGYLVWDYYGPSEIPLQKDKIANFSCLKAKDLLIQGYDEEGNVWATRGMIAYKMLKDDNKFIKQYHIPTGFSIFWLRNFSIIRRLTLRPECVELLPLANGGACAMSAGYMWYRASNSKEFKKTLTLPHYGFIWGEGQGVRNDGLVRLGDGTILVGEYFQNKKRTNVLIYSSKDNGKSWETIYNFEPGRIRHIHALQWDPYAKKVWVCTGDWDRESMVAYSDDKGKTFTPIGQGDQKWRVTQLIFTKEAIYWGADTSHTDINGIYKWDRNTHKLSKIANLPKETFYGTMLAKGTIVLSTTSCSREPAGSKTHLQVITNDHLTTLVFGTKKSSRKMAKLRFPREQGGTSLYISCLNHNECNDGDLIAITENELLKVTKKYSSLSTK